MKRGGMAHLRFMEMGGTTDATTEIIFFEFVRIFWIRTPMGDVSSFSTTRSSCCGGYRGEGTESMGLIIRLLNPLRFPRGDWNVRIVHGTDWPTLTRLGE